jgi:hypothetical protein
MRQARLDAAGGKLGDPPVGLFQVIEASLQQGRVQIAILL